MAINSKEQRLAGGKVIVQRRLCQVAGVGDILHRNGVKALFGKSCLRRLDDLGAPCRLRQV